MKIWEKLKKMYGDTDFARKICLLRMLISLQLEFCDSMELYVNQVIETLQKLRITGFQLDEKWVGFLLWPDSIKSKLIDMDADGSIGRKLGSAFATKFKLKAQRRDDSMSSTKMNERKYVRCFKCKQIGHIMNRCPYNLTLMKTRKKINHLSQGRLTHSVLCRKFNASDWYVDSGASLHSTARKDWLENISYDIFPSAMI
ncbi:hypothetical protein JTB14_020034 [Gonioctena quinquepunctata]|nr:hypothetical protein JTB14_020034 [Gonioctena quinquepunctata]